MRGREAVLAAAALLAVPAAAAPPPAPAEPLVARVRAWRQAHEREILAQFRGLLAIPNVASDTAHIAVNAAAIADMYRSRGLAVELLEVPGAPPAVFARLDEPGASETITFYAHYDGQPADPREWTGAPWTPVLRQGRLEDGAPAVDLDRLPETIEPSWRLYARSSGDDKAPIVGFTAALDALRSAGVRPKVNLHFLFEGEEEAGSPHLEAILEHYRGKLATDAWVLCDGPVHQSGRTLVFFGARGTTDLELTVYGPLHGLHSGHYGNWAPNPISELTHLLDSMRDEDARILVSGYLDDVRPLSKAEERALSAVPRVDEQLEREFAIGRTESGGIPLVEAIQRPAINVRGISGGHVANLASNTIVPEATASIDFRLVPDQTPERVQRLVEAHVRAQGYFLVHDEPDAATRRAHARVARLVWARGYPAWRTPMDLPFSREVVRLVGKAAGEPPVVFPMLGGSIPMYLFAGAARTPVVGLPIANYDDNQHAPNENLELGNLWNGIELYAELFADLGR
jgi:acetylornithine deacetylase/succinyl-diaminopimelate desuccinylase-like protein